MQICCIVKIYRKSFVYLLTISHRYYLIFGLFLACALTNNDISMKTNIVAIVFLILFASALKAQETSKPFNFSVRVGPNISWLKSNSDAAEAKGPIIGFSWGALFEIPLQDNFSCVSGFNIHFAGGKISYTGLNQRIAVVVDEQYTMKYLELPVILKLRTHEVNGYSYYGQLGLGTSFRLSSRVSRTFKAVPGLSSSFPPTFERQELNSDNLTSFIRESLIIGVGAQYSLQKNLKLFGGLNFNNGLTDILKKGPYNTSDPKVISNFVEINVGLYF